MKSTLFALIAAVALVACGKKEEAAAPAPATPASVAAPAPAAAPAVTEPAKTEEAKK